MENKNIAETVLENSPKSIFKEIAKTCNGNIVAVKSNYSLKTYESTEPNPARKTGKKIFTDVESFCLWVNLHKSENTCIEADKEEGIVKATFNDHSEKDPGWRDFKAVLKLKETRQWKAWNSKAWREDREIVLSQLEFSDHLENNRSDLAVGEWEDKDGKIIKTLSFLEMSNLILNLEIHSEETTVAKRDPSNGDVTLHYENNEKEATGTVKPPNEFYIIIPAYESGVLLRLKCRLRRRKTGSTIVFYYIIDQVDEAKDKAFDDICQIIEKGKFSDENEQFKGVNISVLKSDLS